MASKGSSDWSYWSIDLDPERGWQTDFTERFFYYGTGGLLDPKNYTIEPWALSGGGSAAFWTWDRTRWRAFGAGFLRSQAIAFVGMGLLGAILDPLDKTEGGLDEYIGSWHDDWGVYHHGRQVASDYAQRVTDRDNSRSSFSYYVGSR